MTLATLATAVLGVAAGYAGARVLLERETLPEAIPESLRERLLWARERLLRARTEAAGALSEAARVRAETEHELTEDYRARTGRDRGPGSA